MQAGAKPDEMGWQVYENCRLMGALVQTGHEHRTKTLTNMQAQTVDPTCSDPKQLCVGPGRTFVTVTGLGGRDTSNSVSPDDVSIRLQPGVGVHLHDGPGAVFGAQFIIFNYNGNPNKAHGYFKNQQGQLIEEFDITADGGSMSVRVVP